MPTHAAHEALFKPDFSILVQGTSMKRSHSAGLELPKSAFGSYTPLGMKHRLETINHTPTLLVISSLLRKVIDYDGCVYEAYTRYLVSFLYASHVQDYSYKNIIYS